jgi:GT2 family glycosyltransferase
LSSAPPLLLIPTAGRGPVEAALAACPGLPALLVDDSPAGLDPARAPGVPRLRTGGGRGFARACNAGLRWAEAHGFARVLLLNDDAAPEPGCVEALTAAWGPGDGALGPVLIDAAGQIESAGLRLGRLGRVRALRRPPAGPAAVDALSGACLLLSADARFDPGFRHGFEDLALCRALSASGRAVRLIPAARCRHLGGATLHRRSEDAQRHAVSGHLRLVGGGWRSPVVLGLAAAQVLREGGPAGRLRGVLRGWRDWRAARPSGGGGSAAPLDRDDALVAILGEAIGLDHALDALEGVGAERAERAAAEGGEFSAGDQRLVQLRREAVEAGGEVDRRADHGEVEAGGRADVAVADLADVHGDRRVQGG